MEITQTIAAKVLQTVDSGLVSGVGKPIPGEMCVEAAVCYALDLPHGDEPGCVNRALRAFKIRLNDAHWSSPAARAAGLRRLALAQLGSAGHLDDREFTRRLAELTIRVAVPIALRAAASIQKDPKHKEALLDHAATCEREGTRQVALDAKNADAANAANAADAAYAADAAADAAAYAADAAAYAADAAAYAAAYAADAARDKVLSDFAEAVVQLLISMGAPGCQWLGLAPLAA